MSLLPGSWYHGCACRRNMGETCPDRRGWTTRMPSQLCSSGKPCSHRSTNRNSAPRSEFPLNENAATRVHRMQRRASDGGENQTCQLGRPPPRKRATRIDPLSCPLARPPALDTMSDLRFAKRTHQNDVFSTYRPVSQRDYGAASPRTDKEPGNSQ